MGVRRGVINLRLICCVIWGMCSNGTENGYKDVNILHFYSRSFYPAK